MEFVKLEESRTGTESLTTCSVWKPALEMVLCWTGPCLWLVYVYEVFDGFDVVVIHLCTSVGARRLCRLLLLKDFEDNPARQRRHVYPEVIVSV